MGLGIDTGVGTERGRASSLNDKFGGTWLTGVVNSEVACDT